VIVLHNKYRVNPAIYYLYIAYVKLHLRSTLGAVGVEESVLASRGRRCWGWCRRRGGYRRRRRGTTCVESRWVQNKDISAILIERMMNIYICVYIYSPAAGAAGGTVAGGGRGTAAAAAGVPPVWSRDGCRTKI